jgi:hypothetical protein
MPLSLGVEKRSGVAALSSAHPTIVYRYPSRNDDSRTLIATALPDEGYLFSKGYVSGIVAGDSNPRDILALLGLLNSWTCDWWVRRFVDRHVTKDIIENVRLPEWDEDARDRVAGLASSLLDQVKELPGGRPVPDRVECDSRTDALVEIEVAVMEGLGLNAEDLAVILCDFSDNGCSPAVRTHLLEQAARR